MYRPDGGVHFSDLKNIDKSVLHYANSVARTDFDSLQMRLGRAHHGIVLQEIEPRVFEGDRRGKKWDEFKADHALEKVALTDPDQINAHNIADVLTTKEWETAQQMRDSVWGNDEARAILTACTEREVSLSWDREGHPCRGRLDFRNPARTVLGDLKSCKTSEPFFFMRDAHRMHYHAQLPWYDNAYGHGVGLGWSEQYIIATESAAPFTTQVFRLTPLRIVQGWDKTVEWMMVFDAAFRADNFRTGYKPGIIEWDADLIFTDTDEEDEE